MTLAIVAAGVVRERSACIAQFQRRRVKYVASLNDEALPETTDPDIELLYIDIGNVDSEGRIHEVATYRFGAAPSRARRRVRHGDVIISCVRTYLQAIAHIEDPPANLIVSTGFAVVRPRDGVLESAFCKYVLREPAFLHEVIARSVGVSYPAINAMDLANLDIPVPSLDQQRGIASFLDRETGRLDALLAAKERLLELLAEKRRALITRAVTRGLDPAVPLRGSGIPWLDRIPRHWETRRVAFAFRERDERGEPDLPLLEVSINAGVVQREFSDDRIENVAADFNTYKVARAGDIVFNKMRMWQGAVGAASCDGLVSPDYTVACPLGVLDSGYAESLFRTALFSAECARHSHGIVWDRLRLYWEGFRDIRIPVPPLVEQRAIVAWLTRETGKLDALRVAAERTIGLLRERRAALIAAAVTGQLAVGS